VERTTIAGETEVLGENLPSATLSHHKSHNIYTYLHCGKHASTLRGPGHTVPELSVLLDVKQSDRGQQREWLYIVPSSWQ
jgi:hypothetical protein